MDNTAKINVNILERPRRVFIETADRDKDRRAGVIRLAGVIEDSIVDGPGMRYVIFVQGCPHDCMGCHNKPAQDFEGGEYEDIHSLAEKIIKSKTSRITFSGGEPFCSADELARLADIIRRRKDVEIFTYTGYLYEELLEIAETNRGVYRLLCATNYLVDGKFEVDKKTMHSFYRGSSNQRIFDVTCYPNSKKSRLIKSREELCM